MRFCILGAAAPVACGEVSESAEGARLLSEYTGLNLYREFKSLPLRQILIQGMPESLVNKGFPAFFCSMPSDVIRLNPPLAWVQSWVYPADERSDF